MEVVSGSLQEEIEEMRGEELAKKDISLAFDFMRYIVDHPEMIAKLPDGCELEFLGDKKGDALHFYRFAKSFLISPSTPMTMNLLR